LHRFSVRTLGAVRKSFDESIAGRFELGKYQVLTKNLPKSSEAKGNKAYPVRLPPDLPQLGLCVWLLPKPTAQPKKQQVAYLCKKALPHNCIYRYSKVLRNLTTHGRDCACLYCLSKFPYFLATLGLTILFYFLLQVRLSTSALKALKVHTLELQCPC